MELLNVPISSTFNSSSRSFLTNMFAWTSNNSEYVFVIFYTLGIEKIAIAQKMRLQDEKQIIHVRKLLLMEIGDINITSSS